MFGYLRRGGEIRPAVPLCVAPMDPTPSSSHQGGFSNGSLHFGDREGVATLTADQNVTCRLYTPLHYDNGDDDGGFSNGSLQHVAYTCCHIAGIGSLQSLCFQKRDRVFEGSCAVQTFMSCLIV